MRAVVLGASGFLGSNLAGRLVERGTEVYGTWFRRADALPKGLARAVHSTALEEARIPAPDLVFICAAHIPYGRMDTPSPDLDDANVRLPERSLARFPGSRMILASSASVFGDAPSPRTETTECLPGDAYGRSKRSGECAVSRHASFACVRFSSLYGPGMTAPTFLKAIVNDARTRRRIRVFGDGQRTQDYLFIDDACDLMIAAGASPTNGIFLGVSGVAASNARVASVVAALFPGTGVEFSGEDETPSVSYDPSSTFETLRFAPRVSLDAGIATMVGNA